MARGPSDEQLHGLFAEGMTLLRSLDRDAPEVLARGRSGGSPLSALGFPTGSSGGNGNSTADPTAAVAERLIDKGMPVDPVRRSALLMGDCVRQALELLRQADGCRRSVLEHGAGRPNLVELCTECGEPAPKVKRLDGAAYHYPEAGGKQCWWEAYRRRQSATTRHTGEREAA